MTIRLTAEIETALAEAARLQGTTPELLALDCLRQRFVPAAATNCTPNAQGTLADFLAGHIGVFGVRPFAALCTPPWLPAAATSRISGLTLLTALASTRGGRPSSV